ncbi:hypothetical protein SARC_12064 [Sphaeroforma arctica JP610]|uniref:Uncharacterized protein n=1 Tax=Sphaeroforma arctica JP610 TaxID=667725 RepID=A0A0L0FG16_9EUKA|nr:hypothetical protein SARC_12064 [Sphaeroforma arctica JP610]KNC75411.1 hypothetical protein SARC_12064 [Sphaeroforma arctica JP610]|eukprot:XP_014149313.1 hypothetical protein SARC_12064 [Sphaeroforma arctica JP610]
MCLGIIFNDTPTSHTNAHLGTCRYAHADTLSETEIAANQMLSNGFTAFFNTDGTYVMNAEGLPLFRHPDGSVATVYGETLPSGSSAFDSTGLPIAAVDANGQPLFDANGRVLFSDVYGQPIGTPQTQDTAEPATADTPAQTEALTPEQVAAQMQADGWVPITNPLTQTQMFNENQEPLFLFLANNTIHSVSGQVMFPGVPVYDATGLPIQNLDSLGQPQVSPTTGEPVYVDAWFTPIFNRRRRRRQALEAGLANTTSDEFEYVLTTSYDIRYDEANQQVFSGESTASTNELADPQALLFEVNVNIERDDLVRSVVVNSFIMAPFTIPTGATGDVFASELEDDALVTRPWSVTDECIFMPSNATCIQSLTFELVGCDLTGMGN